MPVPDRPYVIAIEEHYWDPELSGHFSARELSRSPTLRRNLEDLGAGRIAEMDASGIDVQVLSHGPPGPQRLDGDTAVGASRRANDRLYEAMQIAPQRFAAFASLPTAVPEAAADELERTVTALGFKGAMVHGLTGDRFLDKHDFWPVFERAQALDVPVYIHPARPHSAVIEAYFSDYAESHPGILSAAWAFGVETATQAVRLTISGVFEAYPRLKILLGHLGEGVPFHLRRLDEAFSRPGNQPIRFRDTFVEHFYITTSGNFSDAAMRCCLDEIGIDRVLFAVDWPFVPNRPAVEWVERLPLSPVEKRKIFSENAKSLLRL